MKEQSGIEHLLDDIGWRILSELQQHARMPFAELGRIVGLSTPAVTERVHKMEEAASLSAIGPRSTRPKLACPSWPSSMSKLAARTSAVSWKSRVRIRKFWNVIVSRAPNPSCSR